MIRGFGDRFRFRLAQTASEFRRLVRGESAPKSCRRLEIGEIEQRMLLSANPVAVISAELTLDTLTADAAPVSSGVSAADSGPVTDSGDAELADAGGSESLFDSAQSEREFVFIDESTADSKQLIADLENQIAAGRGIGFAVLDSSRDGVDQVAELLESHNDLDAIHIVSHGTDGAVKLGSTWLQSSSLSGFAGAISSWGDALATNGDILIYGCDLAASVDGEELVESISALTGSDVAASTDDTGAALLGGDWELELAVGTIETDVIFTRQLRAEWAGLLNAPMFPSTDESLVNTTTGGTQETSNEDRGSTRAVAIAPNGEYVVVWSSDQTSGSDADGFGVLMQRFDSAGNSIGGELQVNQNTSSDQFHASVAVDDTGRGVVVWTDSDAGDVKARLFHADGTFNGGEFTANTTTPSTQDNASVAMDANGNFIVVWEGHGSGDNSGIYGQRFDAAGGLLGIEFRVNDTTSGIQGEAAVAANAAGQFVVGWDDGNGIHARSYEADGTGGSGSQFNVDNGASAGEAAVGMDDSGRLVVTWRETNGVFGKGIYRRVFDFDGTPVTTGDVVNTQIFGDQTNPSISIAGNGEYIIAWEGSGVADPDGVMYQRYDAANAKVGSETAINQTTSGIQDQVSLAMLNADNFVVVWSGNGDQAGEVDSSGVFARQFTFSGQTAVLSATGDTYLTSGATGFNYGNSTSLVVDQSGGSIGNQRALLQFDLSSIPTGATITGATLKLEATQNGGAFNINIYEVTQPWVEGSGNGTADTANWNERNPGTSWSSSGGSYDPTVVATLNTGSLGEHAWDLTSLVQAWYAGSSVNNGIIIGSPDGGTTTITYDSREGTTPPELEIVYLAANTPPTANAGGPYVMNEGDSLNLVGSTSSDPDSDPLTFAWDLDNDGNFGEAGEPVTETPIVSWATLQSFGIDDDTGGPYTIGLEVNDGNGGFDTATTTITVNNVMPTLSTTGTGLAVSGSNYTLNLSASDPGADTIFSWTINWGDGSVETIAGNPTFADHTYDTGGFTYNILASATDEDGTYLQNQLLVASSQNDRVLRYGPDAGFLQAFATSNGSDYPVDTLIGPDGNLYLSGWNSNDVLRYNATTGAFIDAVVPAGSGGLDSAAGLAFGPDGHLYVASRLSGEVLRFDGSTGAFIDAFVTVGSGGLNEPEGLTFGPNGDLYVSDYANSAVYKYDGNTGAFDSEFVTSGSGGLDTAEDLVFGPDGNLYVASDDGSSVLRYNGATGAFIDDFVPSGSGGLSFATGVGFGPDGNLYVGSWGTDNVLRFDGTTGAFIDEYISAGNGGLGETDYFTFIPEHQVSVTAANSPPSANAGGPYVINEGDGVNLDGSLSSDPDLDTLTYKWDLDNDGNFGETGEPMTETAIVPWSVLQTFGIDDSDVPYTIGLQVTDEIGQMNSTTAMITVVDTAPTLTASGAASVVHGSNYVVNLSSTDPGADTITSWTINWGDGTIETIPGNPSAASHVYTNSGFTNNILVAATDEDGTHHAGDVITTSFQTNSVMRFRAADGSFLQEIGSGSVGSPVDVEIGPDGGIYVTGLGSNTVARFSPDGLSGFDFVTIGDGGLSNPSRLAFGPDGNLYVTSMSTDQVLRYDGSTGVFIDVFGDSVGNSLSQPDGIVFGPDGQLYVASRGTGEVLRFDGSSGNFDQVFAVQGTVGYMDIQFGPDGNLWISNQTSDDIQRYDGTSGAFVDTFSSTGSSDFAGFAFGGDNLVYLADAMVNDKIVRYPVSDGSAAEDFILSGAEGLDQPVNLVFTPAQQVLVLNGPPTFSSPSSVTVSENQLSALTVTAPDPEMEPLVFSITGGNDAALFSISAIDSSSASLTFQLPPDFEAPGDVGGDNVYEVFVEANDGTTGSAQVISVTVSDVNESPVVSVGGPYSVNEGDTFSLNGSAVDPEMGPMTFEWDLDNDGQFDDAPGATSSVSWALLESIGINDDGVFPIDLKVTDNGLNEVVVSTMLTISNAPPTGMADGGMAFTTTEDSPFVTGNVLTNDSDPSSVDTLSVVSHSLAVGLVVDNADGTFTYDSNGQFESLAQGQQTTDSFSYTVTDDDGATAGATVTITIDGRNDAPTDISLDNLSISENAAGAVVGNLVSTDVDTGDTHTYTVNDIRFEVVASQLKLTAGQALDFETEPTVNLTVTSSDLAGAMIDRAFVVTVNDLNDNTPVVDIGQTFNVSEIATNGTSLGVVTATDLDGGTTFSNWMIVGGDTDGIFSINSGSGELTIGDNTALDFESTIAYSLTISVSDGTHTSLAQTLGVNVTPVNDETPVVTPGQLLNVSESAAIGTSLGTITATDADTGTTFSSWMIVSGDDDRIFAIDSTSGELTVADNSNLDFESSSSYVLGLQVSDGVSTSATQITTVSVANVNEAPTANSDTYSLNEGATLATTAVTGVLTNDGDVDGDTLTVSLVAGPVQAASFMLNADGSFMYQHDGSETTGDSFTYAISDGTVTVQATVLLTVTPQNDAPVAAADFYSGKVDGTLSVLAGIGLLANDTDADGPALTAQLVVGPAVGSLALESDGGFVFTPPPSFSGRVTFAYVTSDGTVTSGPATVTIVVSVAIAGPPIASSADADFSESSSEADSSESESLEAESAESVDLVDTSGVATDADRPTESAQNDAMTPKSEAVVPLAVDTNQSEVVPETASENTVSDEAGLVGGTPGSSSAASTTTKTILSNPDRGESDSTGRSSTTSSDGFRTQRISREQLAQSLRFRGEDLSFVVQEEYITQVESIDDELQFEAQVPEWAVGSAVVTTTSLSVGYIVWMVRGGYILASVLSTMPVWQSIDPLPVLDALDGIDDDDESLESMIDAVEEEGLAKSGTPSGLNASQTANDTSGVA